MDILDRLNLCYIWGKTYFSEKNRWGKKVDSDRKRNRVFYGFESIPGLDQQVFGGMVKLQDLQQDYPNHPDNPDLLYLVSSTLPYFPVRMARFARQSGVKVIINQNGVAYPGWYGKGWEKQNKPMQELHELADHVMYQSRFCQLSAEKYLGKRHAATEILYNPVDTKIFYPGEENTSDDDSITLLLAGSHWSLYRPQIALEVLHLVCKSIDRVRLNIAGRFCWEKSPETAEQQVRNIARSLGVEDRVRFLGPYTQKEAVNLLRQGSILLHTKYNDPCPRLVVEAMACGLPVVYSATGGTPELVGDDAGIGIEGPLDWEQDHPPDSEQLAEAVLAVISKYEIYSRAARTRAVEKFDTEPWLKRHVELFGSIL